MTTDGSFADSVGKDAQQQVLVNDACGSWSFDDEFFSEEFARLFRERHGADAPQLQFVTNAVRTDPRVLALFAELGPERASHASARLKLVAFPREALAHMVVRVDADAGREYLALDRERAYADLIYELLSAPDDDAGAAKAAARAKYDCLRGLRTSNRLYGSRR